MPKLVSNVSAALLACVGVICAGAWLTEHRPAPVVAHAAGRSPVIVELFTSEGCSSCPPADALLREWNGRTTPGGHPIIGLSEHVTYWNQLGWADPYSNDAFTSRQNGYSERFRLDGVYTPQMVVNGRAELVGSRRSSVLAALDAQPASPLSIDVQSAHRAGDQVEVTAYINGDLPATGADLFAAVTDDMDQSAVTRGENAGETLHHAAVVRELVRVGRLPASADSSFTLPLPVSARKDPKQARHLVLFAQAPGYGPILGAGTATLD